jgi:hypothetical protein
MSDTTQTPALEVINGHYPSFREIMGLPFRLSVVVSALDFTDDECDEREAALQRIAMTWNSHQALVDALERATKELREKEDISLETENVMIAALELAKGKA